MFYFLIIVIINNKDYSVLLFTLVFFKLGKLWIDLWSIWESSFVSHNVIYKIFSIFKYCFKSRVGKLQPTTLIRQPKQNFRPVMHFCCIRLDLFCIYRQSTNKKSMWNVKYQLKMYVLSQILFKIIWF